ncbi:contact-dependent growth inhibition system immunity protein [Burkholderia sp. SRS-W-2-2016]|uniref:contact-dependent growth inhibition system immunity protein n=1 Tax=Burkholderia sp. SRS-W-2-2016 TaxID=1926878 RepID=UPI0015BD5243|nr:contact-dependent growth inhibition system immunity protein [Burkholderia sp. SRS-W-2-2016]
MNENPLYRELNQLWKAHAHDLNDAFEQAYGSQFGPELWGYTTASFLEELRRILTAGND